MICPQCGGDVYDNSQKVAGGWKGPIYKCKDQDGCGWTKWPPKPKGATRPGQKAPAYTGPLAPLYAQCMRAAVICVKKYVGDSATPADMIAATATLFTQAVQSGAPLTKRPEPNTPQLASPDQS